MEMDKRFIEMDPDAWEIEPSEDQGTEPFEDQEKETK